MFDIVINPDGTPTLQRSDFVKATYGRYVAQKIYRALMSMDPAIVTGTDETKPDQIIDRAKAYFSNYFARDRDVDMGGLKITLLGRGGQNMSLSVEYKTTSPDGEEVGITQGIGFSLAGGALFNITYDPGWLSTMDEANTTEIDIRHFITLTEATREVELPIPPTPAVVETPEIPVDNVEGQFARLGNNLSTATPIYVLAATSTGSISQDLINFSIVTNSQMLIYPIGRYMSGYTEKERIILDAYLTTVPTGMVARILDEYGELSVFVSEGSGTISGTARVARAKYGTSSVIIKDTLAKDHVYKLRPNRGRYIASFSKSVAPGSYVVQYKGNTNGRI